MKGGDVGVILRAERASCFRWESRFRSPIRLCSRLVENLDRNLSPLVQRDVGVSYSVVLGSECSIRTDCSDRIHLVNGDMDDVTLLLGYFRLVRDSVDDY